MGLADIMMNLPGLIYTPFLRLKIQKKIDELADVQTSGRSLFQVDQLITINSHRYLSSIRLSNRHILSFLCFSTIFQLVQPLTYILRDQNDIECRRFIVNE